MIEAGHREKVYDRAGKQEKLDRALLAKGLCRAIDAPYFPGDCLFDSVSYKLKLIGMPMASVEIRKAAMRQLKADYDAHDVYVTNVVIPAIDESYNSLNEYIALMSISARDSWDKGRSWGDAIAMQWLAKALKLNIVVWGEDSSHDPPITQSYDYSSGISNRTIDIAHVTLEGFIGHYEPVIRVHNVAFDVKSQHFRNLSKNMQNPGTESMQNPGTESRLNLIQVLKPKKQGGEHESS